VQKKLTKSSFVKRLGEKEGRRLKHTTEEGRRREEGKINLFISRGGSFAKNLYMANSRGNSTMCGG